MNKKFAKFLSLALLVACGSAHAAKSVQESRVADAHGAVDISGVSGRITVQGWDKPSVDVSGTIGDDVDRVDVSGEPGHVSIQIVHRNGVHLWGSTTGA